MTVHEIVQRCRIRGCAITWVMADNGQAIDVDHGTHTLSGSDVVVYRVFPGALARDPDGRYIWNSEQCVDVEAWVDQLHRMPLEEIP